MNKLKKMAKAAKARIKAWWIMLEPEHQDTLIIVGRIVAITVIGVITLRVLKMIA